MALCYGTKSDYCLNACCYISKKRVFQEEIKHIGLENIVQRGDLFFLKNKDSFGTCVFLNEEEGKCNIYDKRLYTCRIYNCFGHSSITLFAQEVAYHRKNKKREQKIK